MYVLTVFIVGKIVNKDYFIKRKNIFFTFPKSEILPDELIIGLLSFPSFEDMIDYIFCGAEEHKDGSPHLHCLIMLKKTINFRLNSLKKHLKVKHFNDAGHIRKLWESLAYVCKNGVVTCWPVDTDYDAMIKSGKQKKGIKTDLVLERAKAAKEQDIDDFLFDMMNDTQLGGFTAFHTKPIAEFFKIYHGTMKKRSHVPPSLPAAITSWILGQNHPTVDIWSWLSTVLKKGMKHGDKHLFIWGPTMSGKSSLKNYLMNLKWNIYSLPKQEDFFDGISDKKWDLAIADEVTGKDQPITFWNAWCDQHMALKQKGKQAYLKTAVIPTILLSNYSPEGLFPKVAKDKPDILAAFERRWNVIPVGPDFGLIDLPE